MPWTSPKMDVTQPAPLSSSAIRSQDMRSGLFDTGYTGADENQALVDHSLTLDLTTFETDDLFAILGKNSLSGDDLNTPEIQIDEGDLNLEVFTDLSQYASHTGCDTRELVETCSEMPSKPRRKRCADVIAAPKNHDHDDYVSKKPRVSARSRTSTVASVSSVDELDTTDSEAMSVGGENKYLERRRKNNIASRRSRENRKVKFSDMEVRAQELEKANAVLQARAEKLEKVTKIMKDALVKRLACAKQ